MCIRDRLYVGKGGDQQLEGALRFFLSPKSAYVSGQVLRLGACAEQVRDWTRPLAGKKALVTGASRGFGASIAEVLARDGAEVVLLDVPQAADALQALAARLGGQAVTLDICAEDAPQRLVEALPEGLDIVVHNAGITRDKTLAKMSDCLLYTSALLHVAQRPEIGPAPERGETVLQGLAKGEHRASSACCKGSQYGNNRASAATAGLSPACPAPPRS